MRGNKNTHILTWLYRADGLVLAYWGMVNDLGTNTFTGITDQHP